LEIGDFKDFANAKTYYEASGVNWRQYLSNCSSLPIDLPAM
jgi:hypothetical protein